MENIGLIVNKGRDMGLKHTSVAVDSIIAQGKKPVVTKEIYERLGNNSSKILTGKNERDVVDSSDVLICLGGDGTFLKTARMVYGKNLAMLGINLGNLGFLTEVERNEIPLAISALGAGEYTVEERMMLETAICSGDGTKHIDTALNDVVISRGALSRILHVRTYINDVFVDMFPGDGLIVSSPTGSTAYSLSAGGPIVEPDIDLIVVSPICPHILYSRSIITDGKRKVKAVIDEEYDHRAMVTVDGQKGYEIRGGDVIEVYKSPHTAKLIRINPRNFYNILRSKIYFRGENLKKDEI